MSCVDLHKKTILVTGTAGFIGSNLVKHLYDDVKDVTVIGIDNMNDYYDVRLKESRSAELSVHLSFVFIKGSIADKGLVPDHVQNDVHTHETIVQTHSTIAFCAIYINIALRYTQK